MATTLTNPITTPPVTYKAITWFMIQVPHHDDGVGNYVFNRNEINLQYEIVTVDDDLNVIHKERVVETFNNFPAGVKTDLRDLYAKIEAHARSRGLIGDGTDEVLE